MPFITSVCPRSCSHGRRTRQEVVRQPEHESAPSNPIPDPVWRPARLGSAGRDEDHLPPEGQEQDPAQEEVESVHVHVLLLG